MGLLTPFVGIQNLDLSPDVLSDTGEALQLWGQLTPGDDGSYTSPSINGVDLPAIRAYQCEQDMYERQILIQMQYANNLAASMPTTSTCTPTSHCSHHHRVRNMRIDLLFSNHQNNSNSQRRLICLIGLYHH